MRSRKAIFLCDETQLFSIMRNTEYFYTLLKLLHLNIIYSTLLQQLEVSQTYEFSKSGICPDL